MPTNDASQKANVRAILVAIGTVATVGVIGSVLSKESSVQIIGFCSMICVGLLTLLQQIRTGVAVEENAAKVEARVREVAVKQDVAVEAAKEVATTLAETTARQDQRLGESLQKADTGLRIQRATHTLVNKETSEKLRMIRDRSKRIVELLESRADSDPAERDAARRQLEGDERALAEHLRKQAQVDAEYGEEAAKHMGTNPPL